MPVHALPAMRVRISTDRPFSNDEMEQLEFGYLPRAMEDKWFIYFSRNRLYFHRSWTGFCVYIAHFKKLEGVSVLTAIEANRDHAQYTGTDDAKDLALVYYLIDRLLLGLDRVYPGVGEPGGPTATEVWSSVGRAMLGKVR